MKKVMLIGLVLLICVTTIESAFALNGCGNQHYFNCGGGEGYHNPGTNQKFKCYEHGYVYKKTPCSSMPDTCTVTAKQEWHYYQCMKCSYGSDGTYTTYYRTISTTHSKSH